MSLDTLLIAALSAGTLLASFALAIDHFRARNRALANELHRQLGTATRFFESDLRYRTIFEHAPVGCVVWEPGFKVVDWNRQAEQLFGWTRDEMLGLSILGTLIPIEEREQMLKDAADLFSVGKLRHATVRHVTRDGRSVLCEWHHTVMRDRDGGPYRIISLCVDITVLRKLERENTLFRSVVDFADDPSVMLIDHKAGGRVAYANDAACRHFGKSREELLGTTPSDWDLQPDTDKWSTYLKAPRKTRLHTFETAHRHASGVAIPVEVTLNFIEHEGRAYTAAYTRNIVQRKANDAHLRKLEVETALHERDRRYREVFEHASDALFIVDVGADKKLVFNSLNPAAEAIFGMPPTTLAGAGLGEIVDGGLGELPAKRLASHLGRFRQCVATGRAVEYDDTVDRAAEDNGPVHFRVQLIPLPGDDGVVRIIGIGRDVTRDRRREAEQIQLLELQRQMSAVAAAVPGFIFTLRVDQSGDIVFPFASPGAKDLFGLSPEEIGAAPALLHARCHPDDLRRFRSLLDSAGPASTAVRSEMRVDHPDMGQRWVEIRAVPRQRMDGNGEWHGLMIDITERKDIEAQLRAREEGFRTLAENTPDIVARHDSDCRCIYANVAFEAQYGIPVDGALGKTPREYWSSQATGVVEFEELLRSVLDSGTDRDFEFSWEDRRGKRSCHYVRAVPEFAAQGGADSVLTVARDITELKETERRLRESGALLQKLSAHRENTREEERRRIARELHEELAQLLSGVRMKIATLPLKYGESLPAMRDESASMLDLVDRAIRSVRRTVTTLRPATLDAGLAVGLEWLVRDVSAQTGTSCELRLPEEPLPFSDTQATNLFRIVQEALCNIARHAQASRADVVLTRLDDYWQLKVRDNGRGFDTKARTGRSFGILGMWERTLMLGGDFAIASSPRHGTVVRLRIPTKQN
jgi:PAS domain S-box-containing protein